MRKEPLYRGPRTSQDQQKIVIGLGTEVVTEPSRTVGEHTQKTKNIQKEKKMNQGIKPLCIGDLSPQGRSFLFFLSRLLIVSLSIIFIIPSYYSPISNLLNLQLPSRPSDDLSPNTVTFSSCSVPIFCLLPQFSLASKLDSTTL